ncbi:unnamed protein product [Adineta ricciae]|uniref:G-protein coupled receptors family 1 profile domain-containing protein n=1 Tax=Adineta ricciae TaxID=249248 RepID=A0A813TRM8_ADIRI|nr:unnamed protein product [Adineta ricciae]CAF1028108.1 unnamed protein product [Adineta ricciae]
MSNERNNSSQYQSFSSDYILFPYAVRFWIILPFYILSMTCSLFVFYCLIARRSFRQAVHNHIIVSLLFVNILIQLTHISSVLNYYRLGHVWPASTYFCMVWVIADEGLRITTTHLFAWATVERHILVFHDRLISTKRRLFRFHYLPILIILLYCFSYCIVVIIFPPCENTYDFTQIVCGSPLCYYDRYSLALWDAVFNDIIPTSTILFFSIALLMRFLHKKSRMCQRMQWRHYRKMTIQLLSIAMLFLVIYIPHVLIQLVEFCGVVDMISKTLLIYAEFSVYYGNLLLPFACLNSVPGLKTKLKKTFLCSPQQNPTVRPHT